MHIDKVIFIITFENIFNNDVYDKTAYTLPRRLDNNILNMLILVLFISPVARRIIQFMHKFSKNTISIYTVTASPLYFLIIVQCLS